MAKLEDIEIRDSPGPGDAGRILHLHGLLYAGENGYGLPFEAYVAEGLAEFLRRYDTCRDRVWICEHGGRTVGTLALMHRDGNLAQLRYFLVDPGYRGIGLGGKLMRSFLERLRECGYAGSFLWTTSEQETAIRLYTRYGFRLAEEKRSTTLGRSVLEQRYDLSLER